MEELVDLLVCQNIAQVERQMLSECKSKSNHLCKFDKISWQ